MWWKDREAPKLYWYNKYTKEYIGETNPQPNPLREDDWLIPADTTSIAPPPKKDGYANIFVDNRWQTIEDHRDEIWYDDSGKQFIINDLGNPAEKGFKKERPEVLKDTYTLPIDRCKFIQLLYILGIEINQVLEDIGDKSSPLYINNDFDRNMYRIELEESQLFSSNNWLIKRLNDVDNRINETQIKDLWDWLIRS